MKIRISFVSNSSSSSFLLPSGAKDKIKNMLLLEHKKQIILKDIEDFLFLSEEQRKEKIRSFFEEYLFNQLINYSNSDIIENEYKLVDIINIISSKDKEYLDKIILEVKKKDESIYNDKLWTYFDILVNKYIDQIKEQFKDYIYLLYSDETTSEAEFEHEILPMIVSNIGGARLSHH